MIYPTCKGGSWFILFFQHRGLVGGWEDTVQSAMTDRPYVLRWRWSRWGTGSLLHVRAAASMVLCSGKHDRAHELDRPVSSLPPARENDGSRRRRMEWRVSGRVGRARSATHRQGPPPLHRLILCLELEVQVVAAAAATAASCLFYPARSGIGTGLALWPTLRNRCTILVATACGAGRTHFLLLTRL